LGIQVLSLQLDMKVIALNEQAIHTLDLAPAQAVLEPILTGGNIAHYEQQIRFEIDYPREPDDPRELSEIPEVRLWFVRADAHYPCLPYFLDWGAELSRYTAMLVPHQFSRSDGIQYNPEALELFVMHRVFVVGEWMRQQKIVSRSKLKAMVLTLGYELDDGFFELVGL
jgi:hypothetical protein